MIIPTYPMPEHNQNFLASQHKPNTAEPLRPRIFPRRRFLRLLAGLGAGGALVAAGFSFVHRERRDQEQRTKDSQLYTAVAQIEDKLRSNSLNLKSLQQEISKILDTDPTNQSHFDNLSIFVWDPERDIDFFSIEISRDEAEPVLSDVPDFSSEKKLAFYVSARQYVGQKGVGLGIIYAGYTMQAVVGSTTVGDFLVEEIYNVFDQGEVRRQAFRNPSGAAEWWEYDMYEREYAVRSHGYALSGERLDESMLPDLQPRVAKLQNRESEVIPYYEGIQKIFHHQLDDNYAVDDMNFPEVPFTLRPEPSSEKQEEEKERFI